MRLYGERVDRLHFVCLAKHDSTSTRLSPNVSVDVVDVRGVMKHPRTLLRAVSDAIAAADATLVVAQDPFEAGVIALKAARSAGLPFIVEEHGGVYLSGHWKAESLKNRVMAPLGLMVMKRAAGLRAVSAKIESDLRGRFPKMEIARIPVYTEPLDGVREGAPHVFGYVGRFVHQKNLEMLFAAFSIVARERPESRLVMVGAGPSEQALRQLAALYGIGERISWLPHSERIIEAYAMIGTLALSSWYEGWARVVPEAMSCGIPVVMTDVGCAGELMRDGIEGYVVPIGDAARFADAMLKVARAEQHALMSAAAKERAMTIATPEELADRLTGFWKLVAGA